MRWDPAVYESFADHRTRPFHELLDRVRATPRVVLDVGCGNGLATLSLLERWPAARVVGLDSSAEMLERAREHDTEGRVEWIQGDAAAVDPGELGADVVVSNAALQWVPTHREAVARWADALPAGGWLAFQVPGNFDAPSHRLMREVAAGSRWADQLLPRLRHEHPVDSPRAYAGLLLDAGLVPDVWETTYVQMLDPLDADPDPVLSWVRGTGLRPLLGVLPADEEATFVADYAAALRDAYPRTRGGVPFEFRRIFAVGYKPEA